MLVISCFFLVAVILAAILAGSDTDCGSGLVAPGMAFFRALLNVRF